MSYIKVNNISENNHIYQDLIQDINGETFDKDFDEIGYEPEEINDSDDDAAQNYGY